MSKRDTRTPEEREAEMRLEYAAVRKARLDETLTRREVLDALKNIASDYGCNGDHDSNLIANAFWKLAEALW